MTTESEQAVSEEIAPETHPENVRVIPVMAPFQFGAMVPMRNVPGTNVPMPAPSGPDTPVIIILNQGTWSVQAQFNQNDALEFANRIRKAAKQARGGLQAARTPLLGANGQVISVPGETEDDSDDDEFAGEGVEVGEMLPKEDVA